MAKDVKSILRTIVAIPVADVAVSIIGGGVVVNVGVVLALRASGQYLAQYLVDDYAVLSPGAWWIVHVGTVGRLEVYSLTCAITLA